MADAASPKKRGRPAKSKDAPAAAPAAAEPAKEVEKLLTDIIHLRDIFIGKWFNSTCFCL